MAGIDLQNLSIKPFCFVQAPGLVVSNGVREHILNAKRRPLWHGPALLLFRPALFAVHLSSVNSYSPILIRGECGVKSLVALTSCPANMLGGVNNGFS